MSELNLLVALLRIIPEVFNMSSVIETETLPGVLVEPSTRGRGPVMAIGGAEDKFRERIILSTFVQLAGGKCVHRRRSDRILNRKRR